VSLVLRDGVGVVALGSLAGAVCASLIAAVGRRLIVGQSLVSPAAYVVVTCLLLVIGITASLRPALRGAATDAIRALRHE
jgi:ABC-type lipoprotein release transport system permease subunit